MNDTHTHTHNQADDILCSHFTSCTTTDPLTQMGEDRRWPWRITTN